MVGRTVPRLPTVRRARMYTTQQMLSSAATTTDLAGGSAAGMSAAGHDVTARAISGCWVAHIAAISMASAAGDSVMISHRTPATENNLERIGSG